MYVLKLISKSSEYAEASIRIYVLTKVYKVLKFCNESCRNRQELSRSYTYYERFVNCENGEKKKNKMKVENFISRSVRKTHVNLFVGPRPRPGLLHLLSWCSVTHFCDQRPTFLMYWMTRSCPSPTPTQSCPKTLYDRIREAEKIVE